MATCVYQSNIYLYSNEEDTTRFSNGIRVNLISPIPNPRHSMLTIKVEQLEMYLVNTETGFDIGRIPFKLRICMSCPTTSQSPNNYSSVLCQFNFWDNIIQRAGSEVSTVIYKGNEESGIGVEILDPYFQNFSIYFTDEQNQPFEPPYLYYLTLKVQVHRNYQAEQVELLGKLVRGQTKLLEAYNINGFKDKSTSVSTEEQGPDTLYAPNDKQNQGGLIS